MNDEELKTLINATAAAKASAQVGAWIDCAAAIQAALPTRPYRRRVTSVEMYAELGPALAQSVMTKLDAISAASRAVRDATSWIVPANGGIDLGHPDTRAMIDQLTQPTTPAGFTPAEAAALKGLAERKPTVTHQDCRRAWKAS